MKAPPFYNFHVFIPNNSTQNYVIHVPASGCDLNNRMDIKHFIESAIREKLDLATDRRYVNNK